MRWYKFHPNSAEIHYPPLYVHKLALYPFIRHKGDDARLTLHVQSENELISLYICEKFLEMILILIISLK